MSDISQLLQEAKPLYFKRKKRRRQMKIIAGVAGCFAVAVLLTGMPRHPQPMSDLEGFYAYLYDDASYNAAIGTVDTSAFDWLSIEETA